MHDEVYIAMDEIRGFNDEWMVENWLYEKNPSLKARQNEIHNMVRYHIQYSHLWRVNYYDNIIQTYWESDGFIKRNCDTIGIFGEVGWKQPLPATAAIFGYTVDDLKNDEINIMFGTYYLKLQLDQNNGNINKAFACYNAGSRWYNIDVSYQYFKEIAALKQELMSYIEEHKRK
jgi:hypothetical protein